MMRDYYIGPVALGGTLPLAVICRNGSGVPSAPTGTPSFAVYGPDDLTTPLATGTLSASDQDSKTGYRTGSLSVASASGFEAGDQCVVLVEYVVSAVNYTDTLRFSVA
jgi:hypothetical protein